jgi:type I restriction-modification system DNA methylase subunit
MSLEAAVRSVQDLNSLLALLRDELGWRLPDPPEWSELTFEWHAHELRVSESAAQRLKDGKVYQLRPLLEQQPWGIFFVIFDRPRISITTLRQTLRGLVSQRRQASRLPSWNLENLLFICTTSDYDRFTFAHFRGEKAHRAVLTTFGWERGDTALRTLCEYNLSALRFPDDPSNAEAWLKQWRAAFDVERVTEEFFRTYRRVFESVENQVTGIEGDDKRLFVQKLFNRLMFVRFLEKKGWLLFKDRRDYLQALWEDHVNTKKTNPNANFYRDRLKILFFQGLNTPNDVNIIGINRGSFLRKLIGDVPYLNGGLFEEEPDDRDPKIFIPDEAIEPILSELFYRFNFTVTESTPLDIEVAVDPEMLGKIFEELVTERNETGSYYTPKPIVAFMCREALKGYLGGYDELVYEHQTGQLTTVGAQQLLQRLRQVKVCDPACGSGAYLVGMLHELLDLINILEVRLDPLTPADIYKRKLEIIENNIYGVDIDRFAVNIARLRLWLSLIVDFVGDTPPPLPNLDFKIEVGDSLTALNPQGAAEKSFRDELVREFQQKKAEYMREHRYGRKQTLREEIAQLRQKISEWQHPGVTVTGFDWAVEFAEVFQEGGFHIVIANPPYGIKCEDPLRFQYFPRTNNEEPQSKDSYGLFMARALQLLQRGGFFTFIVSDTWRTIRSHRPLRKKLLQETTVLHVLDLPPWVFEATVNTCILSLRNEPPPEGHTLIAGDLRNLPAGDWKTLEANLAAIAARGPDVQTTTYARYTYPQSLIATYDNLSFFIGSPRLYRLMSDSRFVRLGDIAEVKQGLATGDNEYYLRKRPGARGSYQILDESKLLTEQEIANLTEDEKRNGVDPAKYGGRHFLPYDKGGESDAEGGWLPNYYVPTQYFIDWSREAIHRLRTATIADVKRRKGQEDRIKEGDEDRIASRFQNAEYYFREGLTFSWTGQYSPTFRYHTPTPFDHGGSCIFTSHISPEELLGLCCSMLARYLMRQFINHTVNFGVDDVKELKIPMESESTITLRLKSWLSKSLENRKPIFATSITYLSKRE